MLRAGVLDEVSGQEADMDSLLVAFFLVCLLISADYKAVLTKVEAGILENAHGVVRAISRKGFFELLVIHSRTIV